MGRRDQRRRTERTARIEAAAEIRARPAECQPYLMFARRDGAAGGAR